MKEYYCNGCYVGAGYGGKCHTSLPELAPHPTICPVFVNDESYTWVEM